MKIIFNAQFRNSYTRIRSISGRVGYFIFRTSRDGRISAYFCPSPKHPLIIEGASGEYRTVFESLSSHLREIAANLGLSITSINFDIR